MCLVPNAKMIIKKAMKGIVILPGKYGKLIEEATLRDKEGAYTLVKAEV